MLVDGKTFQNLSSSDHSRQESAAQSPEASGANPLSEGYLVISGPPGDRTQDTVIKSHVLYH
jgi:hypothetical protein